MASWATSLIQIERKHAMNIDRFMDLSDPITGITLYKCNIYATKKFSFGTWTSRQHVFVSIHSKNKTGWGENIIETNMPDVSLKEWAEWLLQFQGLTVSQAFSLLRSKMGVWRDRMTEMTEMALIDLAAKLKGQSALELLELPGRTPVYGVYVILSDDLDFVDDRAQYAVANGKDRFIKVKLFGDPALDQAVVRTVRKHAPRSKTYLIGDVNCGYRPQGKQAEVTEIAAHLRELYAAGLDACEDPAFCSVNEWVDLQSQCGDLELIPDYPMRPSSKAIHTIRPGMGRIYNIHPGSAGSVLDAIELAYHIREIGAKLMIGDDSLVGPGCTIWQQLAMGLGADWVEATEKQTESDFYYECVKQLATDSSQAPIQADTSCTGFGVELDEDLLAQKAAETVVVF